MDCLAVWSVAEPGIDPGYLASQAGVTVYLLGEARNANVHW